MNDDQEEAMVEFGGRVPWAEGPASAKTLRQENTGVTEGQKEGPCGCRLASKEESALQGQGIKGLMKHGGGRVHCGCNGKPKQLRED